MLRDLIYRPYPDLTEKEYEARVADWKAIDSESESERFYQIEILPRSCARVRAKAPEEPYELLFVPVGTQPYAPIMACLGAPARRTVLLHSAKSREYAEQVAQALAPEDWRTFHLVLIDEWDPQDILRKVQSVFDVLGQPSAADVLCDVTGGTKLMTATLAGIAAMNGWRQLYVKSDYQRKGSYNEELISVPGVFQLMGGWHRGVAHRLATMGHFDQAATALKAAMQDSLATARDALELRRYLLAHAYRRADRQALLRKLPALARALKTPLPAPTVAVLQDGPMEGLAWFAASALLASGQDLAAVGLLKDHGLETSGRGLRKDLGQWKQRQGDSWRLREWRPLDSLVGERYRRDLAANKQS